MLYPSFIFAYNKRSTVFNRSAIIDRFEGNLSVDIFRDMLIKNVELKENNNAGRSTTVDLIEQQKDELARLEREEETKKRKIKDEKLKKEREVNIN